MAAELDEAVAAIRSRPPDAGPSTFVAADALVFRVREDGRLVRVYKSSWPWVRTPLRSIFDQHDAECLVAQNKYTGIHVLVRDRSLPRPGMSSAAQRDPHRRATLRRAGRHAPRSTLMRTRGCVHHRQVWCVLSGPPPFHPMTLDAYQRVSGRHRKQHIVDNTHHRTKNPIFAATAAGPAPAALECRNRARSRSVAPTAEPGAVPLPVSGRHALTAYQRDICTITQIFPRVSSYVVAMVARLVGDIDGDALTESIARVWRRNDGLRLRFGISDGVPYQELVEEMPPIEWRDVTGAPDPAAAAGALISAALDTRIDLTTGGPLRILMIRDSASSLQALLVSHHIAIDATGLFNFAAHILTDYASITTTGNPAPLPSTSFIDCLELERAYRESAQWSADRDCLIDQLRGATPAMFDRATSGAAPAPVRRHRSWLDRSLVNRLREKGISFFPYLCAIVGTYLSRVQRSDEAIIGIPLTNRNNAIEMAAVGGHFANTLPLRVDVAGSGRLTDLAADIRHRVRHIKRCQRFPLGDLMSELRHAGLPSGPLFDVTVNYVRLPKVSELSDILAGAEALVQESPLALAVHVHEFDHDGPLQLLFDYASDVFDVDYPIESVERHLKALLHAGIEALDEEPEALAMLSTAEHNTLIDHTRATAVPYAGMSTVIGRIMAQAARTPHAAALIAPGGAAPLTYAALAERILALANLLREHGVGVGDHVGVLLERGPDMVVAVLAAMHAGAAYVPIDPGYPAERVRHLLDDSAAKVVLADGDDLRISRSPVITAGSWPTGPATVTAPTPAATDLAYVIYTSGSTGQPKGVAVEHRSVINRLQWMQRRYPIGPDDVILQKTPISFDVSVWELFWWAIEGAKVALLTPGGEKDPREILAAIAEWSVTVMHFVPSMLTPFLDLLEAMPEAVERAASLRVVFSSGEALRPQQVLRWNRAFAGRGKAAPRLVNLYGPTEATVDVSAFDCPTDPDRPLPRVPIGRPIDNIRLYVLGACGQPQPPGVAGELCIAGIGVARGYLNRPKLNANKFVPDPFHEGERMYRTGDLARWLADGQLEYLGRIDRQVKIRGNRVELGEVENALVSAAGVVDAVVLDAEKPGRGTYLVAYYVASTELNDAVLRDHLSKTLPHFMLPAEFYRVDHIPLTPSGKADRAALLATRVASVDTVHTAPHTDTEAVLAGVWREVLAVDSVSIYDNFFDLGGDSILMLRVQALAEAHGLALATRDIADHPTVAELAERVGFGSDPVAPIQPFDMVSGIDRAKLGHVEDAYPLTRLQLGMVYHSSERANSPTYHDVFRYSLRMPWEEHAFRTALERLIRRHPVLRTSFDLAAFSEPLQLVYPQIDAPVDIVDLRAAAHDEAEAAVHEHVSDRRHRPYRFDRPGLYHFGVYLLADRIDVVFSFHHAILDGWSVATIVAELLQEYRHLDGGPASPVADAALPSFAEYARAEQLSVNDPADRGYWARLLADAPPVQISGMRSHAAASGAVPVAKPRVQRTLPIPAKLIADAQRIAGTEHVPVKAVFLGAHLVTVGLFAAQADVTSGIVTHGRPERAYSERMAGLFLNTAAVRVNTAGATWGGVVRAAFDQERAGAPHKRFPLFEIQRELDVAVDVAFNYANFHSAGATLQSLDVELLGIDVCEDTNFALLVNVFRDPRDGSAVLRLDGDPGMYTPEQLDLIGHTYLIALDRISAAPAEPVDFSSLAPLPGIPVTGPAPATVLDLFEDRVASNGAAVALEFGLRTVTYGELDDMADRVAAGLLAYGARPGDRIAMAVDRGPELIATVLGIAKVGAACVPLDTKYPAARLSAMLAQASPVAVILGSADESLVEDRWRRIGVAELLASPRPGPGALPVVRPRHAAYVLFTSGSTGTPKGVVMSHRALANLIHWQLSVPSGWLADAGRAPATLQFAPVSFDVAFQEIYSTLCGAGRLILLTEQERRDLPGLLETLDRTRAERVFLPYVALQQLAEVAVNPAAVPAQLRIIVSSGEQLRVTDEIRRLCGAIDGVVLENQYGPTESHVVTRFSMTGDPREFPALPPIGVPIDNVGIVVFDDKQRPVPDGVPGEIYIAGAALADGYEGRPDLTDEAFRSYADLGGVRLYRTGDIGRRLPNGVFVTDGRRGTQVKVRGHRVEPMEVELALRQVVKRHAAGVSDVAVVARTSSGKSSASTQLVAFLVGDADDADDAEDAITAALRDVLPGYMVPSRVEWLAGLPRTPSGKRADRVLATMPLRARVLAPVAPRDEHEAVIAELMADALGVPQVGALDEFFALGGNSLSAVRLIVAIEQRYGLSIPMSALSMGPTVAALAARVRDRAAVAFDPLVAIKPTGSRPPLFLVHPIGGSVLCYVELSKHLPADQPLYALQAEGIDPGTTAAESIPEMARGYVEAIRRVQPDGPYHIGGWSMGGMVAFEMARQLAAQGAEVASVLVLDTAILRGGDVSDLPLAALYEGFMWELLWCKRGADAPVDRIPASADTGDKVLDFILGRAIEHGILPGNGSRELVRRLFEVFRGGWRAIARYQPPVCDRAVTLFRASDPLPDVLRAAHGHAGSLYGDPTNGWDRYVTGRLDVIEVPGDHLTMIEKPNVAALALHVAERLAPSLATAG